MLDSFAIPVVYATTSIYTVPSFGGHTINTSNTTSTYNQSSTLHVCVNSTLQGLNIMCAETSGTFYHREQRD